MHDAAAIPLHLLRPLWLIALVPVAAVLLVRWRRSPEAQWGGVIAPHLLKKLIVKPGGSRSLDPTYLVATTLVLAILALSGPTWRRELPPFVEDKAPLMIALALNSSMNQTDVAPSRIERAKQKIRDLLAARAGARSGLIAYAGTAHLVMPLTDDRSVIEPFLAALTPALMPADGRNVTSAVTLAAQALANEAVAGTILIVSDGLDDAETALAHQVAGRNNVVTLRVAPSQGGSVAALPRSDVVSVSIDNSDIEMLERRIETHFQAAQGDALGAQWRDEGYWLLLPAALLGLLWFRRGTTVPWVVAFFLMFHAWPASAQETSWFKNLWLTPDQQGRIAFDRGDYAGAAKLFADPMWRGIAAYRAYDFLDAAQAFEHVDTIEGRFALGNAQAQNHAYEKAIKAYDEVLKAQPQNFAAKTNRAIVVAALKAREEKREKQEQEDSTPPDEKADETVVDPNQKGGKRIQVTPEDVTTPGAAEAWMRQVQTTPADFLKQKFAIQAAASPAKPEARP
jgi:Ca-activated chloride channel family protein